MKDGDKYFAGKSEVTFQDKLMRILQSCIF